MRFERTQSDDVVLKADPHVSLDKETTCLMIGPSTQQSPQNTFYSEDSLSRRLCGASPLVSTAARLRDGSAGVAEVAPVGLF